MNNNILFEFRDKYWNSNQTRFISINNYSYYIEDDLKDNRYNYNFYSKEFDILLKNLDTNLTNLDIIKLFFKVKDDLKDLSWYFDGNY